MINFYTIQIDKSDCENNIWYQTETNHHYFKLPVLFQGYTCGTTLRVQELNPLRNFTQNGFFLPDEQFEMYFITDASNNSTELMTQLYSTHDIYCMENEILENYYFYKIPWYYIPKNYLDFQPKHLIMMYNMGYLMQNNPNNNQANNLYYNKYYHGIEISQTDIENAYAEFMMKTFSMDNIIVKDYLNL